MPLARVQVGFEHDSGLPADEVVNVFHFRTGEPVFATANIQDMVEDFYKVPLQELTLALSGRLSGNVTQTLYNMDDAPPRVPVDTRAWSFSAVETSLPEEVAYVLSYAAAEVSGLDQARRRGRLFIGPFRNEAATIAATGQPAGALQNKLRHAGKNLLAASDASLDASWVIFSPTNAGFIPGQPAPPPPWPVSSYPNVVGGFVDNAWDTQRRRGPDATSRLPWDAVTPA